MALVHRTVEPRPELVKGVPLGSGPAGARQTMASHPDGLRADDVPRRRLRVPRDDGGVGGGEQRRHLADYVEAVDDYNRHYVDNKTASLQEQSRLVAQAVLPPTFITINNTLLQLNTSLGALLKCISLDEASSESCSFNADNYNYGAYDLYTEVQESMNAQRLVVLDMFSDLEDDLEVWKPAAEGGEEAAEDACKQQMHAQVPMWRVRGAATEWHGRRCIDMPRVPRASRRVPSRV